MARKITVKALADGQLPASKGTLYTVPTDGQTIVRSITVVNTGEATIKVNMFLKRDGSNSRRIWPKDLELSSQFLLVDDTSYTLESGDLIEGDADQASAVDYTISGIEET